LSIGGALGGVFVGVLAPLLFSDYLELHLGLVASGVLCFILLARDRSSVFHTGSRGLTYALLLVLAWFALTVSALPWTRAAHQRLGVLFTLLLLGASACVARVALELLGRAPRERWWHPGSVVLGRVAMGAGMLVLCVWAGLDVLGRGEGVHDARRSFFGVLRVRRQVDSSEPGRPVFALYHGRTLHGFSYEEPDRRRLPTAYFTENSGAARAMLHHPRRLRGKGLSVGIIGLGVGTLATYGRPEDTLRLYEIDPAVIALATAPESPFRFVPEVEAKVEIVPGDARISLERERAGGAAPHDVLIVDAFSSDSIPMHLLTVEAMRLFVARLRDSESLLVFHISNRFFELRPMVELIAREVGLEPRYLKHSATDPSAITSQWVIVARTAAALEASRFSVEKSSEPTPLARMLRPWTDDHGSLLAIPWR
jgi:spermidine synthase